MFKGFYNLASGMITHGKNLDVISNNMTNVATSGFKEDCFTGQTFDEVMWSRVGNKIKNYEEIGGISYATVPSQVYTDYTQGAFDETGMPLDFGIDGEGFFAIQTGDGIAYSRAGNFTLDDEGYLTLPGFGRVLDINQEEIQLVTDKIRTDDAGRIYTENGGFLGQIGVYEFEDNGQLVKNAQGLFTGGGQPQLGTAKIYNGRVERSNVGLVQQMVKMITTQRAYQSSATVTKMYDQVMGQATSDLGRLQ
ncbi:flagellar hook-basal body protein [bacterium D16-76]|nr:flagellar hook-basal body protein [bacterium D16-76]